MPSRVQRRVKGLRAKPSRSHRCGFERRASPILASSCLSASRDLAERSCTRSRLEEGWKLANWQTDVVRVTVELLDISISNWDLFDPLSDIQSPQIGRLPISGKPASAGISPGEFRFILGAVSRAHPARWRSETRRCVVILGARCSREQSTLVSRVIVNARASKGRWKLCRRADPTMLASILE